MGYYSEYLDKQFSFDQLTAERKKHLKKIAELRKREILVMAADLSKGNAPISIDYSDLLAFADQVSNLSGEKVDLILETPGGSGEVAEEIVNILRNKFQEVSIIIPGWAKSAGTIIVMGADEILMNSNSALGPIDAQLSQGGKVFSADALLDGIDKIKSEVEKSGTLNKAFIPMLQGISPGELQAAQNAKDFAIELVKKWLANNKFKNWEKTSAGEGVTQELREARASEIARQLSSHSKWLTHGRSIKLNDLRAMKLQITDYGLSHELDEAITRYHTLMRMSFSSNMYKLFETKTSQIYRFMSQGGSIPAPPGVQGQIAVVDVGCGRCHNKFRVQANLGKASPLQQGNLPFPKNNVIKCPNCANEINLSDVKRQLESQSKKKVL